MRQPLAPFAALALLAGCAEVGKLAAAAVDPPHLTFRRVSVLSLDLEAATLGFTFDAENRNAFGLAVAGISYGVEVEGSQVTAGEVPGGLKLPARGTAPVTFSARVRFRDVPGLLRFLGERDTVHYRLSGKVGLETPLGVLDVPLSHEDQLALPRAPHFSLEGLSLRSVSPSRLALEVRVKVTNPNGFGLPPGTLQSVLSLGGAEVARAAGGGLSAVAAGGSTVVAIPVELDPVRAGRAAADLVRGAPVNVELHGAAEVAGLRWPLELAAPLTIR